MAENQKDLYECLSDRLKLSPSQIKSSAEKGAVDDLTRNLDSAQAERVKSILNDPDKAREILNRPQAQALMKMLGQG